MKKSTYIFILIGIIFFDIVLFDVCGYLGTIIGTGEYTLFLSAIFAEISIYSTLIIFEIKNGGKDKEK
jgi:hypothetical protein